jgi:A/G-specific adenine glycosylase
MRMESFKLATREDYFYYRSLRLESIRVALIRWYEGAKRDLPWRRNRDPYAIWISEIMLQQTRVAAVIPYYEKFLAAFPDAAALARAPEDQVLAMWSGLGYYSRARNLRKAARQMVERGDFPRDYDSIRALAGVGDYTAAAIASIAFGLPHAAIDGNVRRVAARLAGSHETADLPHRLLDRSDSGRWNQAMMELGATVCLPRDPKCGECPVAKFCAAKSRGAQHEFPAKRVKPAPVRLSRTLLLARRKGKILLMPGARVKGFWDLPEKIDGARVGAILGEFRHTILHRHYRFSVRHAEVDTIPSEFRWFGAGELEKIPLSTIARKALEVT